MSCRRLPAPPLMQMRAVAFSSSPDEYAKAARGKIRKPDAGRRFGPSGRCL